MSGVQLLLERKVQFCLRLLRLRRERNLPADSNVARVVKCTVFPLWAIGIDVASLAISFRLRLVRHPETGQREAGEPDAEFLEHAAPRDGLSHVLGQFIEFVVHNFPFILVWFRFQSRTENL